MANTRSFILAQFDCIAAVIVSRTPGLNGSIRTECVNKINGLFETGNDINKKTNTNQVKIYIKYGTLRELIK